MGYGEVALALVIAVCCVLLAWICNELVRRQRSALGDDLRGTTRDDAVDEHTIPGPAYATVNGRLARLTTQEGAS